MLKTIRGWFSNGNQLRKPHQLIPGAYTLGEWRSNTELPKQLKKVLDEGVTRHAMAVLYNQIPSGFPLRGEVVTDTQAAIELGRMNGYIECLSLFKSLAISPELTKEVEQTYGADDKPDNWS